jgi:hypothetical protein
MFFAFLLTFYLVLKSSTREKSTSGASPEVISPSEIYFRAHKKKREKERKAMFFALLLFRVSKKSGIP